MLHHHCAAEALFAAPRTYPASPCLLHTFTRVNKDVNHFCLCRFDTAGASVVLCTSVMPARPCEANGLRAMALPVYLSQSNPDVYVEFYGFTEYINAWVRYMSNIDTADRMSPRKKRIRKRYWVSTTVWAITALYEAGLKTDCKLTNLRTTLGLKI